MEQHEPPQVICPYLLDQFDYHFRSWPTSESKGRRDWTLTEEKLRQAIANERERVKRRRETLERKKQELESQLGRIQEEIDSLRERLCGQGAESNSRYGFFIGAYNQADLPDLHLQKAENDLFERVYSRLENESQKRTAYDLLVELTDSLRTVSYQKATNQINSTVRKTEELFTRLGFQQLSLSRESPALLDTLCHVASTGLPGELSVLPVPAIFSDTSGRGLPLLVYETVRHGDKSRSAYDNLKKTINNTPSSHPSHPWEGLGHELLKFSKLCCELAWHRIMQPGVVATHKR